MHITDLDTAMREKDRHSRGLPSHHGDVRPLIDALLALAGWLTDVADQVEALDVMDLVRAETILRDIGHERHFFEAAMRALNNAALEFLDARELALDAIRLQSPNWAHDAHELHLRTCRSTLLALALFVDTRADELMRDRKAQGAHCTELLVLAKQDASRALAAMNAALSG